MQCNEDRYGSITVPILRNPSRVRLRKGFPISIMTSTLGDAIPPEKLVLGISSLLTLSDLICYGNGSEYAIKSQLNHFISGEGWMVEDHHLRQKLCHHHYHHHRQDHVERRWHVDSYHGFLFLFPICYGNTSDLIEQGERCPSIVSGNTVKLIGSE